MSRKLGRRLWHIVGGLFFPALAFVVSREVVVWSLAGLATLAIIFEIVRFAMQGANPWLARRLPVLLKEQERQRPTGTTYLLLASVLTFWLFPEGIAIVALVFLALGDPAAAFIGENLGKRKFRGKSLEGSLAFLTVCLISGAFLTRVGTDVTLIQVLVGAVAASLVEVLPIPVDDNLRIPLVGAAAMLLAGLLPA